MDRGKEYLARFADYLKNFGVEQEVMPLEAPWKNGRVEKAGGLVPRDEERVTTMCASLPIEAIEGSFARNGVSLAIVARRRDVSDMLSRGSCDLEWLQTLM